ncbi:MAG TPA: hypothetical protein VMH02_10555 [Verrucomicrobiae bacterium]|nr:hypothetical protein [Verrucomicrobiae bacterium]
MLEIEAGFVRAYYLFDVADTIDLRGISTLAGEGLSPAEFPLRPHTSSAYLQFPLPPLVAHLPEATIDDLRCTVRVKLFDYGVISLRLSFVAKGTWDELAALAERVRTDVSVAGFAAATGSHICDEIAGALDDRHEPLIEDYFAIEIDRFTQSVDARELLERHGAALACTLLGENVPLSDSETEEALRVRFSYTPDDLTLVQWDTAFVYDRGDSARAIEDILEFANSQLLELRTYDALLDRELDSIYKMNPRSSSGSLRGRREAEQAETLRYLLVDVLELIDRSSNALKVVGDAYYARIYRAAAKRLGLAQWQRQIDSKLASVNDMYRYFSDRARARRDEFLELVIIALIALELLVGIAELVRLH